MSVLLVLIQIQEFHFIFIAVTVERRVAVNMTNSLWLKMPQKMNRYSLFIKKKYILKRDVMKVV